MNILIVAPHPDDEVLGAGGTIARMAGEGHQVTVAIATRGWQPLFPEAQVQQVREESRRAAGVLKVANLDFMDLPVTRLHALPEHELNAAFGRLIDQCRPNWVLLPFPGDRHEDHRQVFDACMVALRPTASRSYVQRVLCYETVSETHWSAPFIEPHFQPNLWIDISNYLPAKLEAMRQYVSQIRPAPDARSIEAIQSLATWRGSLTGMAAAECFVVIRDCLGE